MIGKVMTSLHTHKDVLSLIPRTYEYIILHGKRDIASVIKDFKMERLAQITQEGPMLSQGSL
jgi:hypothetical protein